MPPRGAARRKVGAERSFVPPSRREEVGAAARLKRQEAAAQEAAAAALSAPKGARRRPSPVAAPGAISTWDEEFLSCIEIPAATRRTRLTIASVRGQPRSSRPRLDRLRRQKELWRLRRLYAGEGAPGAESFEVITEQEENRVGETDLDEQHGDSSGSTSTPTTVRLVLHCTDPDWEAVNWAPDGLLLEISVPKTYPDPPLQPPSLRVLGPADLPGRFAQLLPRLFAEFVDRAAPRSPAIYRGLQHVDRYLVTLFLKVREAEEREAEEAEKAVAAAEAARAAAAVQQQRQAEAHKNGEAGQCDDVSGDSEAGDENWARPPPWTRDEQDRLEEALEEFTEDVQPDAKMRWTMIALRVGGDRTARQCAVRCRELDLDEISLADLETDDEDPVDGVVDEGSDAEPREVASPGAGAVSWSAADVRRLGVEVRLVGLCLEGFDTLLPSVLRLQVVCTRCKKPSDLATEPGKGTDPRTAESPCPVCKQVVALRVAPAICHGGCPTVAHVLGVNCMPTQLLRSDFEASCGECTEAAKIRNVGPGYRKRGECTNCFAKLNLAVEGAELLGNAVAQWRQVAESEGERMNARKQLHEARQREKELGVKAGQPLPNNGTCKHYTKSYRWLRFPCCGRAFPCDVCHDDQMDHPHEWANRMLCGRCSYEQPFSKDSCRYCGASQTRSRSAYWEGGEGCRNRTTMSRNDPHKYRGLGKCLSSKVSARIAKGGSG